MKTFQRWLPALFMMAVIFVFSSRPSDDLPYFGMFDALVKKSGHAIGYGLLSLSYLYPLGRKFERPFLVAWALTMLYAATDEYHQSFIPGRHPSISDILVFDNLGAVITLYFAARKRVCA